MFLIILTCVSVPAIIYLANYPAYNFNMVKEGVLYRSGQPGRLGWLKILDDYGIRTVVCVREYNPVANWFQLENDVCQHRNIPVKHRPVGYVTDEDVMWFMHIMNHPGSQPVLIHCQAGSVRTGVIVAAYRMVEDEWSYVQAVDEARNIYFDDERHVINATYLLDLEKRLKASPSLREKLRTGKLPQGMHIIRGIHSG